MATSKQFLARGAYRSTTLRLYERHCARALDFAERGEPIVGPFNVGEAAHFCLQRIGEATIRARRVLDWYDVDKAAREAAGKLIERGREFEGDPSPPMPADDAYAGRDLALNYCEAHPLEPLQDKFGRDAYEVGLAIDHRFRPIPYSKSARWRGILDRVSVYDDVREDSSTRVLEITDYKSSWVAGEADLETTQRRGQVLLAVAHYGKTEPPIEVVRRRVVNLRTGSLSSADILLANEPDTMTLSGWRMDWTRLLRALDAMRDRDGNRPASPGVACVGCPFFSKCEAGQRYAEDFGDDSLESRAARFVRAKAELAALAPALRAAAKFDSISVEGGFVGYKAKPKKALSADAWLDIVEEWDLMGGGLRGFAKASGITKAQAERLFCAMYPQSTKADRLRWLAALEAVEVTRAFDVHASQPKGENEDADEQETE